MGKSSRLLISLAVAFTSVVVLTGATDKPVTREQMAKDQAAVVPSNIKMYVSLVYCSTPDPSDTTGQMRVYVKYLEDTNTGKIRPLFFSVQNGFNHTVGVDLIEHHKVYGQVNWWTRPSFVLTTPNAYGQHAAGNIWPEPNTSIDFQMKYFSVLPAMNPPTSTYGGTDYHIYRNNGNPFNYEKPAVSQWQPWNEPWWTPKVNNGPLFLIHYHVQGHAAQCSGWYPVD